LRNRYFRAEISMESKKSLEVQLRDAGWRFTPQRRLILSILDSTDDHLDADCSQNENV